MVAISSFIIFCNFKPLMKGPVIAFLALILTSSAFSQTGPAGVGTSASNVFWLKADAGTSSSVNATPISSWNDQSGNSINMSQTVAAQQPSFATNVINGFPAIQFDNVNGAGVNDKMIGPDSPILDNTSGYSFFTVSRPQNFGDAHVIVSKRTTVSVDQSFMLFYYTSNKMYIDIQTTNDRFPSNMTFSVNNNYIIDLIYDGTLPSGSRCNLYSEETLDKTAAETSTLVPDNASPIILGTTDASDPRPFGGYISEVIIYRQALPSAQRIIVNNYLSAKYNVSLSANDKYLGDNPGNGDYDREVAGIGQESTGSNPSFSASISGGLTISSNSGLDNGDYILAGHATPTNIAISVDVGGMTGVNNSRWQRIWYVDVTNTLTAINTNIEFDMSDGGVGGIVLGTITDYVLLYRAGQAGNWTELTTASSIIGDRIIFSNYNLVNDGYYTIGTKNYMASPLPIELISFNASTKGNKVNISWSTASEKNNDFFTIQKTADGINFETVSIIKSLGEKSQTANYKVVDSNPYSGSSYYRLAQTDFSGETKYSQMVYVNFDEKEFIGIKVFPNPSEGIVTVNFIGLNNSQLFIEVTDMAGKLFYSKTVNATNNSVYTINPEKKLTPGTYNVIVKDNNKFFTQKIVVK